MNAGFLVIDKPAGITSHDVVAAVRAVTGIEKVGHTGTLDPFATGVLPLALGGATRLIQFLDESIKVYDATIRLGCATDTGDPTGKVIRAAPVPSLDADQILKVLATFEGDRMQTPPAYSAVKHKGRRLYEYARQGEEIEVAARPITIHGLRLVAFDATPASTSPEIGADPPADGPTVRVEITCTRGTYARVLADEIATALGTAGHLAALCRTRSGPFYLCDALGLPQLAAFACDAPEHSWVTVLLERSRERRVKWQPRDAVRASVTPFVRSTLDALAGLPIVDLRPHEAHRVRAGGPPPPAPPSVQEGRRCLLVAGDQLVAIAERTATGTKVLKVMDAS
jgi:tRNA pseudouridine55 synthase